jgi:hypothetical protein
MITTERRNIMSCPKCNHYFSIDEIIKILKVAGVKKGIVLNVEKELVAKDVEENL